MKCMLWAPHIRWGCHSQHHFFILLSTFQSFFKCKVQQFILSYDFKHFLLWRFNFAYIVDTSQVKIEIILLFIRISMPFSCSVTASQGSKWETLTLYNACTAAAHGNKMISIFTWDAHNNIFYTISNENNVYICIK